MKVGVILLLCACALAQGVQNRRGGKTVQRLAAHRQPLLSPAGIANRYLYIQLAILHTIHGILAVYLHAVVILSIWSFSAIFV